VIMTYKKSFILHCNTVSDKVNANQTGEEA